MKLRKRVRQLKKEVEAVHWSLLHTEHTVREATDAFTRASEFANESHGINYEMMVSKLTELENRIERLESPH